MTVLRSEIRPGAYYDSIVLMQLQSALADLPKVLDAGVVMATPDNLALLEANGLLPETPPRIGPDDLLVVVRAETETAATDALGQVDALLARSGSVPEGEFRPRSLVSAVKLLAEARWVLVSVPGRYAAGVARDALDLGRHVFIYSDNVSLTDEVALKQLAQSQGLLVMGPDCGTAIINGVCFGFANRVRGGAIGLVGASGTGLQAISSEVHALRSGVSQAIGTGGRDLQAEVGGLTARQGLDLLGRDPQTRVIVLVSKPPAPAVARRLLAAAQDLGKPVVVSFLGFQPPGRRLGSLHFATSLKEAATMAVELLESTEGAEAQPRPEASTPDAGPRYLRGLFSGGTLAYETLQGLKSFLSPLYSNVAMEDVQPLPATAGSQAHTILDLGADELTVGRPHPMMDNDLRLRRLRQEAADPEVGLILLDLVLGEGAHPDPAGELAPAIAALRRQRGLEFVAIVIGTDDDPQDLTTQIERLTQAGARVVRDTSEALGYVGQRLRHRSTDELPAVGLETLRTPVAAINVGLESFYHGLVGQQARAVQVDWRPPAGGNETLMAILEKTRR